MGLSDRDLPSGDPRYSPRPPVLHKLDAYTGSSIHALRSFLAVGDTAVWRSPRGRLLRCLCAVSCICGARFVELLPPIAFDVAVRCCRALPQRSAAVRSRPSISLVRDLITRSSRPSIRPPGQGPRFRRRPASSALVRGRREKNVGTRVGTRGHGRTIAAAAADAVARTAPRLAAVAAPRQRCRLR